MLSENNQKRRNVLERMSNEMGQLGIPARLIRKGEEGSKVDLLVCAHGDIPGVPDGVSAQYFFPEVPAAEDVFYFACTLTIKQGVTATEAKAMQKKIEEINPELVCGNFEVFPGVGLVYKLGYALPEEIGEDELLRTVDIAAAHALVFAKTYAERLLG